MIWCGGKFAPRRDPSNLAKLRISICTQWVLPPKPKFGRPLKLDASNNRVLSRLTASGDRPWVFEGRSDGYCGSRRAARAGFPGRLGYVGAYFVLSQTKRRML